MSSKELVIEHPRSISIPRKTMKDKEISINLNTYRNLHFQVNNQCKTIAKANVLKYLEETGQTGITFDNPVDVYVKVYKKTRGRLDKGNVFAVATKYFYDALVDLEVLPDDNDDFIKYEVLQPTEIDKENPRIVLTIKEHKGEL